MEKKVNAGIDKKNEILDAHWIKEREKMDGHLNKGKRKKITVSGRKTWKNINVN